MKKQGETAIRVEYLDAGKKRTPDQQMQAIRGVSLEVRKGTIVNVDRLIVATVEETSHVWESSLVSCIPRGVPGPSAHPPGSRSRRIARSRLTVRSSTAPLA